MKQKRKDRIGDRKDFDRHKKLYYTLPSQRIGNLIWLTLGGWAIPLYFLFIGALYFITIIGIKKAYACFRFAQFSLLPFGVEVRLGFDKKKFGNLFWLVTTGWIVSLFSICMSLIFRATVIGTPLAWQWEKLSQLTKCPFGAKFGWEKPTLRLLPVRWFSKI